MASNPWPDATPGGDVRTYTEAEFRRVQSETIRAQAATIAALREELAEMRDTAIPFLAIHAAKEAAAWGLPDGHLHAHFYDRLKGIGGFMDRFTRADDPSPAPQEETRADAPREPEEGR